MPNEEEHRNPNDNLSDLAKATYFVSFISVGTVILDYSSIHYTLWCAEILPFAAGYLLFIIELLHLPWVYTTELFAMCLMTILSDSFSILITGLALLSTGASGLSLAALLCRLKGKAPGSEDFGRVFSCRVQLVVLQLLIVVVVNGYMMVAWGCLRRRGRSWHAVGLGLMMVEGAFCCFWCISEAVGRWREACRENARVSQEPLQAA